MFDFTLEASGGALKMLKEAPLKLYEAELKTVTQAGRLAEGFAKKEVEKDTGSLGRNINTVIKPVPLSPAASVGFNLKYGIYREKPTRAHFVPFRVAPGFRSWAIRHGFKVPEDPTKGGLKVTGEEHPFLKPAKIKVVPLVPAMLRANIVKAL